MLFSLSLKYSLLVFIAVMGVLQAAAAYNNLRGLLFIRNRFLAYVIAILAVGFSLFIFFIWNHRYATGIIGGSQQFGLFVLASVLALVCTLLASAAINYAFSRRRIIRRASLRALRGFTAFSALWRMFSGGD